MTSNPKSEEGRPSITPSARPPIHSAFGNSMGRYGLHKDNKESPLQEQDVDEVDNVQSKFAHSNLLQISPRLQREKFVRRNSSQVTASTTDDSDDNVLAKSLPAQLPSYINYSEFEVVPCFENNFNRSSGSNRNTPQTTRNISRNGNDNQSPPRWNSPKTNVTDSYRGRKTKTKVCTTPLLLATIMGVMSILFVYLTYNKSSTISKSIYDENRFFSDMGGLGQKYKVTNDAILQLQSGISTIFKRQDTGSFIIVYNSKMRHFNTEPFYQFVDNVAKISAKYLRNETAPFQHIVVESSKLNMESHSDLINKYRDDVTRTGVMLVKDLDQIPSALAMAFHYYCDEYNPLAKKSAIFFTLDLAKCHEVSDQKSSHANVEKCLTNIWNEVPRDNIRPLLTRVVSVIIDVSNIF